MQLQLTSGGEIFELVRAADVQALERRVETCEKRHDALDAKISMAIAAMHETREMHKGAPPALAPPPRRPPPRPIASRRLSSASQSLINEVSITGHNAVVSWNSYTPGATAFNCTGVGDGKLTCSGALHVTDVTTASGTSVDAAIASHQSELVGLRNEVAELRDYIGLLPPSAPPPASPPLPPQSPGLYLGCSSCQGQVRIAC